MSAVADKIVRHVLYLFPRDPLGTLTYRLVSMSMALFTWPEMVSPTHPCVWKLLLICLRIIDVVAPIEREIRKLAAGLVSVKDEQEYIVVREKTHRNTAESTNSRVKWWSVLQAIVLFSVVAWQVYYLKVSLTQFNAQHQYSTYIFSLSLK